MGQVETATKQKQSHRYRVKTCVCPGREGGRGVDWEIAVGRCKLLHIE